MSLRERVKEAVDNAFYDSSIRPSASDVLHRLGPILDELETEADKLREAAANLAELVKETYSECPNSVQRLAAQLAMSVAAYDRRHPRKEVS